MKTHRILKHLYQFTLPVSTYWDIGLPHEFQITKQDLQDLYRGLQALYRQKNTADRPDKYMLQLYNVQKVISESCEDPDSPMYSGDYLRAQTGQPSEYNANGAAKADWIEILRIRHYEDVEGGRDE